MSRFLPLALAALFVSLGASLSVRPAEQARAADALPSGSYATVASPEGYALKVRSGPSPDTQVHQHLAARAVVRIVAGPKVDGQGWHWYQITGFDQAGIAGWSVGYFLSPLSNAVMQTPATSPRPPFRVLARVTAYNGAEYNDPWGGRTRLGTMTRPGVAATDPTYIPLGSELMIEGVDGVYVAEDTGSGVHGYHVDVWMPTYADALTFGSRWTYVTVLGRPYER